MRITWENKRDVLKQLKKKGCIEFALKAAKLVNHLSNKPKIITAIKAIETWLENPNDENAKAAENISKIIYDTENRLDEATCAVACAASAIIATYSSSANYAENTAVYATKVININPEEIKHQLIQYLKELYLDSLPEEEKYSQSVWLVIGA
jgi:hypothetical protein